VIGLRRAASHRIAADGEGYSSIPYSGIYSGCTMASEGASLVHED